MKWNRLGDADVAGLICSHPLAKTDPYWNYRVPLLEGDHVTDEQGTGFVHTAPGHGAEDYAAWMANKVWHDPKEPIPHTVGPDGAYLPPYPALCRAGNRAYRGQEGGAGRPGEQGRGRCADRGGQSPRARAAGTLLPALMAVEGPGHLP